MKKKALLLALAAALGLPGAAFADCDASAKFLTTGIYQDVNNGCVAIGQTAKSGPQSTAVGANALATDDNDGQGSVAFGYAAQTSSPSYESGQIALGYFANAFNQGIALGKNSTAIGGIVIGNNSSTNSTTSITIGNGVSSTQEDAITIGAVAGQTGWKGVAIGVGAAALGNSAVSIGASAGNGRAADGAVNIGAAANSNGLYGMALGYGASNQGNNGIAIGPYSYSLANNSVALGANSYAHVGARAGYSAYGVSGVSSSVGEVAIGTMAGELRNITGLAPGFSDTDAVNVVQLKGAIELVNQSISTLSGNAVQFNSDKSIVNLSNTTISGVKAGVGSQDAANVGQVQTVNASLNAFKLGAVQYTDGTQAKVSFGGSGGSLLVNVKAGVASTDAVNVGQLQAVAAQASAGNPLGVNYADATGARLILSGAGGSTIENLKAGAAATDAVNVAQLQAVAAQAATGNPLGIAYSDSGKAAVMFGGASGTTLQNVAAGVMDTDAVNVAQLNEVNTNVSATAAALGGGSLVGAGGFIAPAYTVTGSVYHDVGAAFNAVDSAFTQTAAQLASLDARIGATGNAGQSSDAAIQALTGRVDLLEKSGSGTGSTAGVAVGGSSSQGGNSASIAQGSNGVAVGGQAAAGGQNATAIGGESYAAGPGDTAIGGGAKVNADYSTAVGSSAHVAAVATHSVALGANSEVTQDHAVAVGEGSQATAKNSVALGAGSVADRENTVSVGAAGSERAISNVAAGTSATDAATVGQVDASTQKAIDTAQGYTDKRFTDLQTGIDRFAGAVNDRFQAVDRRVNGTGAMATAMSQMGTASAGASGNGRIAAGVGFQGGERAISVGYATPIGERMHLNFGGAATATQRTVGAGIGVDL